MKCPKCGKFLAEVTAYCIGPDRAIAKVAGKCKQHGEVYPTDWDWDDFFGGTSADDEAENDYQQEHCN